MITYIISVPLFQQNKTVLDDKVFWKVCPQGILIRMAVPSPGLQEWLEKNNIIKQ